MSISRRSFLRAGALTLGASTLLSSIERFGFGSAIASSSINTGYRALVVVFLFGGNDSNNMLIPNDPDGGTFPYSQYGNVRFPDSCDFSIPKDGGRLISPSNYAGSSLMLHPSMPQLASLFNGTFPGTTQRDLAILCNTGTLVEPSKKDATRTDKAMPSLIKRGILPKAAAAAPTRLMSHLDQQREWQSGVANPSATTALSGWGGRIADVHKAAPPPFPTVLSDGGAELFTQGAFVDPMVVSPAGLIGLADSGANAAFAAALAQQTSGVVLTRANQMIMKQANAYSNALNVAMSNNVPNYATAAWGTGSLSQALRRIADVIAASGPGALDANQQPTGLNMTQQVFFCGLGGFDTHAGQHVHQASLLAEVDDALAAFYRAMADIGARDKVVLATQSDFGRTLKPASSAGTDHAWGSHHLILGGPVNGGKLYGAFPDLTLGGVDDLDGDATNGNAGEGRWVPTTSAAQYAATLAGWVEPSLLAADLDTMFPNLPNFATKTLPFL
jgi:uncharacterized protein (DUF1501 family)